MEGAVSPVSIGHLPKEKEILQRLRKLRTLLVAYSLAGSQPIPGVPDASKEQVLARISPNLSRWSWTSCCSITSGPRRRCPLCSRARGGLAQAQDAEERYACPIASRAQAQSRVQVLSRTHGEWQSHSTPAFVMASAVAPAATRAVAAELAAARWFCKLCLKTRSWQTFHGVSQARDLAVQCKAPKNIAVRNTR